MNRAIYSDEAIIDGLRNKNREIISYVYRNYFDSIQRLIDRNSGKNEDAEDIFQDSLMIVYRKLKQGELKLSCSLKTYIYAISRNLWLQKLGGKNNSWSELDDVEDESAEPFELDENLIEHEKYNLYQKHFLKLSKDCQRVLKLFLKKTSLKEITKIMNFNSVDYTKTRKYLCKKNLKESILNDPESRKYVA